MRYVSRCLTFAVMVALTASSPALADDAADAGRRLLEEHKLKVVTVKIVAEMNMMGQSRETASEATGTVIAPSGLTVLSLSETDPAGMIQQMMSGMGQDMDMGTQVTDVKILLEDGTEVPSKIILRDKDNDLAFVLPTEEPSEPMVHVNLDEVAEVQILDQLIVLNRLGKVTRRAYSASIERIEAIVTKPRTFYIPGNDPTNSGLGCPVFTLDGKFLGIMAIRVTGADASNMFGAMLGGMDNLSGIIVPAADINEAAQQATEAAEEVEQETTEDDADPGVKEG